MDLTHYISAAPEMTLLGLLCAVLIADLFVEDENRVITFWLTMLALLLTGVTLLATAPETRVEVFSGSYVSDAFSQILKLG
ncbi:MAG: hypothetical protein WBN44_04940, partial [Woeseiaceae bacterium]